MDQALVVGASGGSAPTAGNDSDPRILELVRQGVTEAFDVLYKRHFAVAQYVARSQTDNASDADDVVAEAFASVFQSLKEGKGPKEFFRAYLLTVVRRTAHDRNRKAHRALAADDALLDSAVFDEDNVVKGLEATIMARAFKSLPERWQAVLWHVDIEGLKPAAVAPLVGLSPNGVSSLAIRAREGLRQAYLQHHINETLDAACAEYAGQLGKYARNALKRTSQEKVGAHLETCAKCTALLIELNDVQGGMRAVLWPLLAGGAFTPGAAAVLAGTTAAPVPGPFTTPGQANPGGGKDAGLLWKAGAGLAIAVLALVGLLGWLMQPTSHSAGADAAGPATTPIEETATTDPAPGAVPSPTPSVEEEPPAVVPVEAEPQVPAVVIPEQPVPQRKAAVTDSGVSTTPPQVAVAAAAPSQTVEATFTSSVGATVSQRVLQVRFSLQGDGTPTSAEVIFTLPDQATFVSGQSAAPAGWDCVASGTRQLRCASAALDTRNLNFTLQVDMPQSAAQEALNSRFAGKGIVTKTFANVFH